MYIDLSWIVDYLPFRFYTNDLPRSVQYPYILVHLEDYMYKLRLWSNFARSIILDIHVHRFRKEGDYPLHVLYKYYSIIKRLAQVYREKIIFVLPDLPFDPDYFRGAQYSNNIRKTYMYHVMYLKYTEKICRETGSKMILVVQHRQSVVDALRSSCIVQDMLEMLDSPDVVYAVGVGSLCINRSPKQIATYINNIAYRFPKFTIHGFGVRIDVLRYLTKDVHERYSFDGTGWTRPVNKNVQQILGTQKRYSCKNEQERTIYFLAYVARLLEYAGQYKKAQEILQTAQKIAHKNKH